jgi:hypothetical protein
MMLRNVSPRADSSNGYLVAYLRLTLAWESFEVLPSGRQNDGGQNWTLDELLEFHSDCWDAQWRRGVTRLAREMDLI